MNPYPVPPPPPNSPVSTPWTFQGFIDQALLDDIEEFASLGWLDCNILDSCQGAISESEPLA